MKYLLYFSTLLCSLPFAFRWPFFGLCAYLTISFAEPKVLCWHPELQDSLMMGLCFIAGAVAFGVHRRELIVDVDANTNAGPLARVRSVIRRNAFIEPSILLIAPILLIAYIGLTRLVTNPGSSRAAAEYSRLCKTILVTLLMTGLVPDLRRARIIYAIVALAASFWAVKGGFKVVSMGPHQVYGPDYDNNLFALKSVMALPLLYYFGVTVKRPRWRTLLLVCSALVVLAILGSKSRSGFLAMVFVLIGMAWTSGRRIRAMAGVAVVASVAVALSWSDITTRYDSIVNYRQDRSATGRLRVWPTAWRMLAENPVTGVGFNNFETAFHKQGRSTLAAHNIWLQNLCELGLLGHPLWLVTTLGPMAALFTLMYRARRGPPALRKIYFWARGLFLGMCAFWIHGMFHNEEYLDLMFAFIGLTIILRVVYARTVREIQLAPAVVEPRVEKPAPVRITPPAWGLRPWIIPT